MYRVLYFTEGNILLAILFFNTGNMGTLCSCPWYGFACITPLCSIFCFLGSDNIPCSSKVFFHTVIFPSLCLPHSWYRGKPSCFEDVPFYGIWDIGKTFYFLLHFIWNFVSLANCLHHHCLSDAVKAIISWYGIARWSSTWKNVPIRYHLKLFFPFCSGAMVHGSWE